jgi:glycosyltransferase involved in cell wall biosynthesis
LKFCYGTYRQAIDPLDATQQRFVRWRHCGFGRIESKRLLPLTSLTDTGRHLAIAAPSFNAPSETFIRNHVRTLAPGATILLCQDDRDAEKFGYPVLSPIQVWHPPQTMAQRIVNGVRYRWGRYVHAGLGATDRRRVLSFLAAHRPRAMLAEYGTMGCLLAGVCREAGVPLYVHFHGYDGSLLLRDPRQVRHYRRLFRCTAGIVAPSRFLANKLADAGCPQSKLHISSYGVDPFRFSPTRRFPQHVLAVGRLVEKKAPHYTIEAFGQIAQRYPQARLDMVGDGPLAERCCALIGDLGLDARVRMHGVQNSEFVARLMREASLFVQHSVTAADGDSEGLPVAILEAMASALPVIATRHSGIPEAVEHGVSGLLVDEGDVDTMAAAMAQLLDDRARAAAMGAAGRARVLAHFTLEQSRDRLRALMGLPPLSSSLARCAPCRGEGAPAPAAAQ